jgi:folylpolyglutamate synthase/dihydropteroate synthase
MNLSAFFAVMGVSSTTFFRGTAGLIRSRSFFIIITFTIFIIFRSDGIGIFIITAGIGIRI